MATMSENIRTTEATWSDTKQQWRVRVRRDGEPHDFYSTIPGKKGKLDAETKADKWLKEAVTSNAPFDKAWDDFIAYRKDHASKDCHVKDESLGRLYIKPIIGKKKLAKLVPQDWQDCILAGFDKGLHKRSCENIKGALSAFVSHCEMQGITITPTKRVKVPKSAPTGQRKILQPADLKTLFSVDTIVHYKKPTPCMFIHAWRFIVLTGVRRGELCGLQRIDIEGNAVFLQRAINKHLEETDGKTDAARRYVALSKRALAVLEDQKKMLMKMGIVSPWLFPDEMGEQLDPNHLYKKWYTYRTQHGIATSLHEMRHTFVSLVKVDMPESLLKPMVGHVESMDTFGVYAHRVDSDIDRTAAIIDDVFSRLI